MFDINKCHKDKDGNRRAQTLEGNPVTLIFTNGREPWPLGGYEGDTAVSVHTWHKDGSFLPSHDPCIRDLTNIPEPKRRGEVWVDVIEAQDGRVFARVINEADYLYYPHKWTAIGHRLIARFSHKWTEGEGLEGK